MSFENQLKEEMRLVMLRLLNELPSYRGNSSTLHSGLTHWGLSFSRDQVKTELYWLKDQGCVEIELDNPDVIVVKLKERGQDVVENRTKVHGIKRPSA
ncbi:MULTISPECIES: VpaChn25_0724 family phage protein [Acinetobacter]|uniref:ArsR family transcriptional regulator n=1 Tax=Acinetobacter nematophilus TaxID=2994642 RepID=A0A9X3IFV4_9GAMM|nr:MULTISPECIES: ArsR family transcriptional regulator [Acinetobacter]MBJ8477186.1 ArsR family transcriptional regulator [Acinetobacter bereziniae]MCX5466506.1 ArsR family transcriptional regulator [Acinetobacter nematophilus]